jgi:hypothetical protein
MKDPIVEEVRRFRREHAQRFGNNLQAICEDLRQHQAACGHRIVRLPARRTPAGRPMRGTV